jgi:hypothetical protein
MKGVDSHHPACSLRPMVQSRAPEIVSGSSDISN